MATTSSQYSSPSAGRLTGWLTTTLAALFALAVTGGVVALVVVLQTDSSLLGENEEFVWRRLFEDPPRFVAAVPVGFGLLTLLLVVVFRREGRVRTLLVALLAIGVLSALYVPLALALRPIFSWMIVLVPMLAIALFYAGLMYIRDARSIHPAWAGFLGLCRCLVYTILAVVFLLPGCQTFDQSVKYPKVLMIFDTSASVVQVKDDSPAPGQDPKSLPTRQDKVIEFLTAVPSNKPETAPFLDRVLSNTDVVLYRFGKVLDEKEVLRVKQGGTLSRADLSAWLKPDKDKLPDFADLPEDKRAKARFEQEDLIEQLLSGTNIPGSVNAALKLENNSFLQGVIVVSDGTNNAGSAEQQQEMQTRVSNPRRNIPLFTIGVGEYRQPIGVQIEDVLAPEVVRPDDKFPIRVPVIGHGLGEQEFKVTLQATRLIVDDTGKEIGRDSTFTLGPKAGKFKGGGDHPTGTVEFEIDVQDLKKIKAGSDNASLLEGPWEFVARVPRHPLEAFDKDEHVSDPVKVLVQKKELRILLFASGPTSEYKFLRTLLFREQQQKRVEVSVLLQSAVNDGQLADHVDLDVDREHVLVRFPNHRGEAKPGEKQYCLNEYDAIIAVDPDWSQLTKEQLKLLKDWVEKDGGGVVFVAGPVNTHQLARPAGLDLSALITIFPVLPKDSRLHGLQLGSGDISHDSSRPYVLHFTPAAKNFDFLKVDEKGDGPTAGWDAYFWADTTPEAGKSPRRGFYNYYPIAKLKPDSAVIATFGGPTSTYFEDTDGKKKEQPFMVSMRYGAGKTVFLGAGEFWRMRVREGFHERFWVKLSRYVAAGAQMQKQFGQMYLARSAAVGTIHFDARLRTKQLDPLPADSHPVVLVRKLSEAKDAKAERYDLKPQPVEDPRDWDGKFSGDVKIREEGKYEFKIPIPGTADSLRQEIVIRKPNPEMDNVRNDFDYLYKISSEFKVIQNSLPPDVRKEVQSKLKAVSTDDGKESPRLFFALPNADAITKCLRQMDPQREKIKGPLFDLWDKGTASGLAVNAYYLAWGLPLGLGVLGFAILLFLRQSLNAALFLAGMSILSLAAAALIFSPLEWPELPIDFSFVLVAVVGLLSVEWLTRKLLKLA